MAELIIPENIIEQIKGTAIPKPANDQNTDDLVPARYLKEITFQNMGEYLYHDERFDSEEKTKNHVFNNEMYAGSKILIGGANYGCGSSREHAAQAVKRAGIEVVMAESLAEIFAGNCASIGVVGVTASKEDLDFLAKYVQLYPKTEFTVDLKNSEVSYFQKPSDCLQAIKIDIPEDKRNSFLKGTWDLMKVLQQSEELIKAKEQKLPYLSYR